MPCSPRRDVPAAALALLLLVAGCARPPAPLPPAAGDPLAVLRARTAAFSSVRARFSAVAHLDGTQRQASGVLLARRPDALRLRLIAPFGITVLDYTRSADGTAVWLPADSAGPAPPDLALFAHLGLDDALPSDRCHASGQQGALALYTCTLPPHGERLLAVDPETATLRAAHDWFDGQPVLSRTYDDYRLVGTVPLPYRLSLHAAQATVEVRIDAYELDPPLGADAFRPPPGAVPLPPPPGR